MSRSLRIVAVTAGLLVAGAIAGALAADAAMAIALAVTDGPGALRGTGEGFFIVTVVGALFGGVLLPATAWIFLRRVALGLALLGTVLGTIAGGVVGWIVNARGDQVTGGVIGAIVGFAVAALLLRVFASAPVAQRVSVR